MGEPLSSAGALFVEVDRRLQGQHIFSTIKPSVRSDLLIKLSKKVRAAYFDQQEARERLTRAASDLKIFSGEDFNITEANIYEALIEELEAVIPQEWKAESKRLKTLDVQRSELAEIIGYEVLSAIFSTAIPASRIRVKEIPDQPTRGADIIGVEAVDNSKIPRLIVGEVKGSCDSKSPPGVIDGMVKKLTQLSTDRRVLLQELVWLRDNSDDEHAEICARMCAWFQFKKPIDMVLTPILLRTELTARPTDPGKFGTDADSFGYDIRFISVIIDADDLFDFAAEVYDKARGLDRDEP